VEFQRIVNTSKSKLVEIYFSCAAYLSQNITLTIFFQDESKGPQIPPKSSKKATQNLPNHLQILPKSTSDGIRNPFGDYMGTLIEKNMAFEAKKIARRRPGAPRRGQNGVKIEVKFDIFLVFFSMLFFNQIYSDFSRLRT